MKFKFILIFDCDGHDSDCYSPVGFYISLSDSLLSWKRKKQARVACLSDEAEYKALIDITMKII